MTLVFYLVTKQTQWGYSAIKFCGLRKTKTKTSVAQFLVTRRNQEKNVNKTKKWKKKARQFCKRPFSPSSA